MTVYREKNKEYVKSKGAWEPRLSSKALRRRSSSRTNRNLQMSALLVVTLVPPPQLPVAVTTASVAAAARVQTSSVELSAALMLAGLR